jgi:type IV secretory pathway VirB10-like protein
MPKKYRLVRTDPGVLDLSQVLDEQGRPVLLKKANDFAVVDEVTSQHPMVQRFIGAGLKLEEVSLTPVQAPATPVVEVTAPPKPPPKPAAPAPPEVMTKESVEDKPADDEPTKAQSDASAPKTTTEDKSADKPKSSKKSTKRKYGSK